MTTESMFMMTATEPCPSWCQESAGHPYVEDLGEIQRWHRARVGDVELTQLDCVRLDDEGVQMVTDGVRICISDDAGMVVDLTTEHLAELLPVLNRIAGTLGA